MYIFWIFLNRLNKLRKWLIPFHAIWGILGLCWYHFFFKDFVLNPGRIQSYGRRSDKQPVAPVEELNSTRTDEVGSLGFFKSLFFSIPYLIVWDGFIHGFEPRIRMFSVTHFFRRPWGLAWWFTTSKTPPQILCIIPCWSCPWFVSAQQKCLKIASLEDPQINQPATQAASTRTSVQIQIAGNSQIPTLTCKSRAGQVPPLNLSSVETAWAHVGLPSTPARASRMSVRVTNEMPHQKARPPNKAAKPVRRHGPGGFWGLVCCSGANPDGFLEVSTSTSLASSRAVEKWGLGSGDALDASWSELFLQIFLE